MKKFYVPDAPRPEPEKPREPLKLKDLGGEVEKLAPNLEEGFNSLRISDLGTLIGGLGASKSRAENAIQYYHSIQEKGPKKGKALLNARDAIELAGELGIDTSELEEKLKTED